VVLKARNLTLGTLTEFSRAMLWDRWIDRLLVLVDISLALQRL
jgi:hypothetical protein